MRITLQRNAKRHLMPLQALDRRLRTEASHELRTVWRQVRGRPQTFSASHGILNQIASQRVQLHDFVQEQPDEEAVIVWLEGWTQLIARQIAEKQPPTDNAAARQCLSRVLHHFTTARAALANAEIPASPHDTHLVIPSEFLFEAMHRLLPAERMAILAGRQSGADLRLTACFDVTHEPSATVAHVRADPTKLSAALLALEGSGSRLLAWAHSHPGIGPRASLPSSIDWRQYEDWTADFGPLLALIVTQDGHARLWGEAVNQQQIIARFEGEGIHGVDEHVYRLHGRG